MQNCSSKLKIIFLAILFFGIFGLAETTSAERFFQQMNTWYEKIPDNPVLFTDSANYVADILINSGVWYMSTGTEWGQPICYATVDTAIVDVVVERSNAAEVYALGWHQVPIPVGCIPAGSVASCAGSYRDGQMFIVSHDRKYVWSFSRARYCGGTYYTKKLRKWDLENDNGILENYPDQFGLERSLANAGFHGVLTYDEVANDTIDHAILFLYFGEESTPYNCNNIYPCFSGYRAGLSDRQYAMKFGIRLQLNPSYDCSQVVNVMERSICVALQEYGMFYGESTSPGYNYIVGNSADSWGTMHNKYLNQIPLNQFRVVKPVCSDCSICPDNCVSSPDTTPPVAPSGLTVN